MKSMTSGVTVMVVVAEVVHVLKCLVVQGNDRFRLVRDDIDTQPELDCQTR